MLCRNGIPYDVAESWPDHERRAHFIIFSEMDGREYDFERDRFLEPTT